MTDKRERYKESDVLISSPHCDLLTNRAVSAVSHAYSLNLIIETNPMELVDSLNIAREILR